MEVQVELLEDFVQVILLAAAILGGGDNAPTAGMEAFADTIVGLDVEGLVTFVGAPHLPAGASLDAVLLKEDGGDPTHSGSSVVPEDLPPPTCFRRDGSFSIRSLDSRGTTYTTGTKA